MRRSSPSGVPLLALFGLLAPLLLLATPEAAADDWRQEEIPGALARALEEDPLYVGPPHSTGSAMSTRAEHSSRQPPTRSVPPGTAPGKKNTAWVAVSASSS